MASKHSISIVFSSPWIFLWEGAELLNFISKFFQYTSYRVQAGRVQAGYVITSGFVYGSNVIVLTEAW